MAKNAVMIWLHGLGDSGPANASIASMFSSPRVAPPAAKWNFPSAPSQRVTCNYGEVMPSWFDLAEIPITAKFPNNEEDVLKAVRSIHSMIDKEVQGGSDASNIFLCGFSQGGALTLASSLLYPKTLGGAAVFSGWMPLNSKTFVSMAQKNHIKRTPMLWMHGTDDEVVEFGAAEAARPWMEEVGISCEFKPIRGLTHTISQDELFHLEKWLDSRLS